MQLERLDLHAAIQLRFPDNLTGDITPQLLRDALDELVDSVFVIATDTGAVPNVPLYKAGTTYVKGFTVRWTLATREAFYAAQFAGKLPAPIGPGDLNWTEVAPPVTATALWQAITLTQAQGMDGAGAQGGRLYQVDMGTDATGATQLVYLMGLDQFFDTTRGVLEVNGVRTAIQDINLGAGTWQLPKSPRQGALLTTADVQVPGVVTTHAIAASYLNTALTLSIGYDVTVTLPPLTAATVPSLLRLECNVQHGVGYQITVPGVSRPLNNGEAVLLAAVVTPAQPPQTGFPGAPAGTAWRVLSEPVSDLDTSLRAGSYQVQPADLPAPTITATNAALFAAVRLQRLSTGGLVRLSYGTHYTVAGNVLTILAATNAQPGDLLHYSYVPGASSASYTDAQARAAQLNRTPAAGTTTVTLTAEAATDYGTAASGTFTVDATGCAIGKVACFTVGAGATAPLFTNAPTGQAYKFVPSNIYASGKAFNYSILVRSDRIEVVIFED